MTRVLNISVEVPDGADFKAAVQAALGDVAVNLDCGFAGCESSCTVDDKQAYRVAFNKIDRPAPTADLLKLVTRWP